MQRAILLLIAFTATMGCSPKENDQVTNAVNIIEHAKNLEIFPAQHFTVVKVRIDEKKSFTYILYKNERPEDVEADAYIKIPIATIACTSTSHLPAFDLLDAEEKLVGFPSTDWIYDSTLRAKVGKGTLHDIGQKQGINNEKLISLQPDVLMAYQMPGTTGAYDLLKQSGIAVLYNADFTETTPLGRAEWMKLTAALLDKNEIADSIFNTITQAYELLRKEAADKNTRPTVMTGIMYGDTWYVPGGKNYSAQFIIDAGGNYLWSGNDETGSMALGFENVLEKAQNADFWIGTASINSYTDLANTDERYTYFKPFKTKNIFSYTKRTNASGSNDYLESGYARPDLVLRDYLLMLHPQDTTSASSFTYFEALK